MSTCHSLQQYFKTVFFVVFSHFEWPPEIFWKTLRWNFLEYRFPSFTQLCQVLDAEVVYPKLPRFDKLFVLIWKRIWRHNVARVTQIEVKRVSSEISIFL